MWGLDAILEDDAVLEKFRAAIVQGLRESHDLDKAPRRVRPNT
jgi:hypothetical protein